MYGRGQRNKFLFTPSVSTSCCTICRSQNPFLSALIRIQKSHGLFPAGSAVSQGKRFNYRCLILFWESEVDNACYWQIRGGRDRDCLACSGTRPSQMWWGRVLRTGRKWAQVEVRCESFKGTGSGKWLDATCSFGRSNTKRRTVKGYFVAHGPSSQGKTDRILESHLCSKHIFFSPKDVWI